MKKTLKRTGLVLCVLIVIIALLILVSYINHKVRLSMENALFVPVGRQVEVNGHSVNVFAQGNAKTTLVFMSGGGTCSPVLDFKSLYSLLSDKYRVVVVEKAGYGFSQDADVPRDVDTVLSETREALALAEISGPFVLCPHSLSAIEAIYWAQLYPDEVRAIVGLDMAVPASYENWQINLPLIKLGAFAASTGITRWFPALAQSDAVKYGTLTAAEQELYKVIFYRRTATTAMINEARQIKASAAKVARIGAVSVPTLLFSSNGVGTGWDEAQWRGFQNDFIKSLPNGTLIELNCSHYVHNIEYARIAEAVSSFLTALQL